MYMVYECSTYVAKRNGTCEGTCLDIIDGIFFYVFYNCLRLFILRETENMSRGGGRERRREGGGIPSRLQGEPDM